MEVSSERGLIKLARGLTLVLSSVLLIGAVIVSLNGIKGLSFQLLGFGLLSFAFWASPNIIVKEWKSGEKRNLTNFSKVMMFLSVAVLVASTVYYWQG